MGTRDRSEDKGGIQRTFALRSDRPTLPTRCKGFRALGAAAICPAFWAGAGPYIFTHFCSINKHNKNAGFSGDGPHGTGLFSSPNHSALWSAPGSGPEI